MARGYKRILSLGVGVQSSTILFLAEKKIIDYIDEAIFCDTGNEPDDVYLYLEYLKNKIKNTKITVLLPNEKLSDAFLRNRMSKNGNVYNKPMIPLFSETGMMQRQCTFDFKIKPMTNYIKTYNTNVKLQIGYSTDELYRIKSRREEWIINEYPLIKLRMNRRDCITFFLDNNLNVPPKSSC